MFILGQHIRTGSLDLATTVDNRLFSASVGSSGSHTGGHLFDVTVQSSSVPCKTTLSRMLGLIGLVSSAEIHFTGFQFWEMPTALKNNWQIFVRSYERAC